MVTDQHSIHQVTMDQR
uniref:Uncharacterized protein n=1 Tax=Anguilla anguilla TaxID=7936 RepID=A0A0E9T2T2_ANGAN